MLATRSGNVVNGCITNTCIQVANNPVRIAISVLNSNYTCDLIKESGIFTLSLLDQTCSFETIRHFGFQSGRDVDKLDDISYVKREENGIISLTEYTNAVICAKVVSSVDLGTHTLFIADVTKSESISDVESATYAYYHSNIKTGTNTSATKGYVCTICGYVHEGSELPDDFICPLCNHGAKYFEKIK